MAQIDEALIGTISEKIKKGECILFLGAGAHYPPPAGSEFTYPEAHRPPLGSALSQSLAAECDFEKQFPKDSTGNLQRVSLFYEVKNGRQNLVRRVSNAVFSGKRPSPILCALARMNFPLVITTNYDQLFELALQ